MNEGRTKLTRLEILIMSSMNNSRAMNSSEGSGQTEKLCEMHCRWMTKADVEIKPKDQTRRPRERMESKKARESNQRQREKAQERKQRSLMDWC